MKQWFYINYIEYKLSTKINTSIFLSCFYRIEGIINPDEVLTRLHQGVADNEAFLVAERADRAERSMTQTLRQQQDEAYLESL